MCPIVMSSFSCDHMKTGIDEFQQCLTLFTSVQYSQSTWFLDGRTSILIHQELKKLKYYSKNAYFTYMKISTSNFFQGAVRHYVKYLEYMCICINSINKTVYVVAMMNANI